MAQELADKIRAAAQAKGIDPEIALRIAKAESSVDPAAKAKTSTAGGLFQVVDKTWKEFGGAPGKKFDPDENIRVGTDIIAKNTQTLKGFLNRDPRPAEIYAAHYFGPSGAKSFLSADPATPIVDILGKQAVKANPNLQGKNVGQVMAQLETKMGGPKRPDVSRETPTPVPRETLPPSLPPMAAAEPDAASSKMASLGPSYQAALALSFLADTDDKEERDIDREPGIAEQWMAQQSTAPSLMAQFSDVNIKSPFAEPKPQMLAHGGMVQHMSGGGLPFTPTATIRPSARRELDAIKAQYDQYNKEADAYNKAADAYNASGQEGQFTWSVPVEGGNSLNILGKELKPVVMRTDEPVAPTVTPEEYEAKGEAARRDARNRNLALQVAADPARFGLTSMDKLFAEGGEVEKEESTAAKMLKAVVPMDLRILGSTLMGNREPITESNFRPEELAAMQQAVDRAAARTGKTQKGSVQYVDYPRGEEIGRDFQPVGQTLGRFTYEKSPTGQTVITDKYDFYNEGRKANVEKYEKMGRAEKALSVSGNMLKNLVTGNLRQVPGELADAYIGRDGREVRIQLPVKRSGGGEAEPTPEEIAAASRPATVNPMIQRQGEAARRLAAMRDVNTLPDPRTYAAVSGFLGQAPDEMGFSVMHPDAEGIKKAGQAGFGVGTAVQVAPLAGAVRNLVGKGTTQASKALEGLKNIPVGASTRQVEPIFTPIPSGDAPFVGRLDEMVASLQGPVQKDQFLGMLKGKMRDYDIARAESTLADLPGNAKLSPVDLLNQIKAQYDPSQFKTTVIPPKRHGDFYQSMDNPYKNGPPLGVIHLSQGLLPEVLQQQEKIKDVGTALTRIATQGRYSPARVETSDKLLEFLNNPGVPLSETTAAKIADVANQYRKAAEFDRGWEAAKESLMYPILDKRWSPLKERYAQELAESQGKSLYADGIQNTAAGLATRDISLEGNQWLASNGFRTVDLPDFTTMQSPALYVASDPDMLKAVTLAFDDARETNKQFLKGLEKEAADARMMFGDDIRPIVQYQGQHASLNNPPSPISFSRFSEHTTEIPGIGKVDGIYVNELQSDLLDDLRKKGPKGGSAEKDKAEIAKIQARQSSIESEVDAAIAQKRATGVNPMGSAQVDKLIMEHNALEKRLQTLEERMSDATYDLPESFAGMETSPQVAQQLMAKNAIVAAIQQGKSFVAFPGAESAQAQLYEKLPRNLKSVVKDLGPGFELRDIKLMTPDGREMMHSGVVWGPEAAARIQKKGVPFKDGGAVERQTADHRKYL